VLNVTAFFVSLAWAVLAALLVLVSSKGGGDGDTTAIVAFLTALVRAVHVIVTESSCVCGCGVCSL
jgi:hypothetical protein